MNSQPAVTYAWIAVQCAAAPCGTVGTFLRCGDRRPLSPIFDSLAELFPWMEANGWSRDEYEGGQFLPWRVSRPITASEAVA